MPPYDPTPPWMAKFDAASKAWDDRAAQFAGLPPWMAKFDEGQKAWQDRADFFGGNTMGTPPPAMPGVGQVPQPPLPLPGITPPLVTPPGASVSPNLPGGNLYSPIVPPANLANATPAAGAPVFAPGMSVLPPSPQQNQIQMPNFSDWWG